jgi:hypothetical protein
MQEPESHESPPPRRLPVGLMVLAGSVLASFLWWWSTRPPDSAERDAPEPVASAPAPAPAPETPAEAPAPAPPRPVSKPREAAAPEKAAPPPATPAGPLLRVSGDVVGADVFVDRTFVGKTPFESRDIATGSHQINISKEGFDGVSRKVEILPDGPTEVTFALKAVTLDAAVDVVHKHRLGSCEGRLTATVQGLRYTPTGGDDGFETPLATFETFAVDYQQKQLKLKIKGGKAYNFTTKAANADSLFVFHRDVEKARARLAGAT